MTQATATTGGRAGGQKILPVASTEQVRRHAARLILGHRRELAAVLGLYTAATIAGLIPARLLGGIVSAVQHGTTAARIDQLAGLIALALIAQSGLIRYGALAGARLGEGLLARLREEFVGSVLALPLSVVEEATAATCCPGRRGTSTRWAPPPGTRCRHADGRPVGGPDRGRADRDQPAAGAAQPDRGAAGGSPPAGICAAPRRATCGRTRPGRR